jgi:hypothetical protein
MANVAKAADVFPIRLYLTGISYDADALKNGGGYADVLLGNYEQEPVCVKKLRLQKTNDIRNTKRVRSFTFANRMSLLNDGLGTVSRGHHSSAT